MTSKWSRIPANDAAETANADATETQLGTGINIPSWAKSVKAIKYQVKPMVLTTDEEVAGYVRLYNDNGTIEPLYLPLNIMQTLTGAIGTHITEAICMPLEVEVTGNDTLRAAMALDAAVTGAHTYSAEVLFSSEKARFKLHSDRTTVQALQTTSDTPAATAVSINTVSGKISAVVGAWGYMVAAGGITAGQSCLGRVKIKSAAKNWMEYELGLNLQASGLSTQIGTFTKPVIAVHKSLISEYPISGMTVVPFGEPLMLAEKQQFDFVGAMEGINTAAPAGRYGLMYIE